MRIMLSRMLVSALLASLAAVAPIAQGGARSTDARRS